MTFQSMSRWLVASAGLVAALATSHRLIDWNVMEFLLRAI